MRHFEVVRMRFVIGVVLALLCGAFQKSNEVEIPFRVEINLIMVDITINGKGPIKCAFDTGADYNQLLPDAARRVGLIDDTFKDLAHPHGTLTVGGAESPDEEFRVEHYPALDSIYKMNKTEGTVGYPFISKHCVKIDYQRKKLTLRRYNDERAFPELKDLVLRKGAVKDLFMAKKYAEAGEELENIFAAAPKGSSLAVDVILNAARAYAASGNVDKTVGALTKMKQSGFTVSWRIKGDPAFRKMQNEKKFQDFVAADKPDPKKIPFSVDRNHIVFEGTLNQKGPFKILFDTGSTYVTVLPEVAQQLGLTGDRVDSLKIGPTELKNVKVKWDSPLTGMMKEFGTEILLGSSFLSNYRITIDFLNQEITLDPVSK